MTGRPGEAGFRENPFPLVDITIKSRASILAVRGVIYSGVSLVLYVFLGVFLGWFQPRQPLIVGLAFLSFIIVGLLWVDHTWLRPWDLAARPLTIEGGRVVLERPRLHGFLTRRVALDLAEVDELVLRPTRGNGVHVTLRLKDGPALFLGEKRVEEMERLRRYLVDIEAPVRFVSEKD